MSSTVLVKIGTAVTCMLASFSMESTDIVDLISRFLDTEIGSYCDPDCLSSSDEGCTLARIAMFKAPAKLFEVVTAVLRPHYSWCTLTGLYPQCGDVCRCSEVEESKMYRT